MLLAVEIDNSRINFGLFDQHTEELIQRFEITTDIRKTSDEYAVTVAAIIKYYGIDEKKVNGAVVASVVPQLTDTVKQAITKLFGSIQTVMVGKGIKTGFPIKVDNPSELGTDLVTNAAAVIDILNKENISKCPCVIIDMGTATTIFAVNSNGEYIGGSIMAGVGMSLEALHGKTALLPNVSLAATARAIGKNSQESVRSGVVLGNAFMLDGFIDKIADEMKCGDSVEVFATGEYAEEIIGYCTHKIRYVKDLTLNGLLCIYKNNIKA